jgi:hypothetical protein
MYTTAFVIGFFTSFGWWSAAKIQSKIDNTMTTVTVEQKEVKEEVKETKEKKDE